MTGDLQRCVDLLQRMIRTPSLPGKEGELADVVADEMRLLGYDEVRVDEVGNVLGLIKGRGEAPGLMFNTHLDIVDVGDPAGWPHPPFGGEIHDGNVDRWVAAGLASSSGASVPFIRFGVIWVHASLHHCLKSSSIR